MGVRFLDTEKGAFPRYRYQIVLISVATKKFSADDGLLNAEELQCYAVVVGRVIDGAGPYIVRNPDLSNYTVGDGIAFGEILISFGVYHIAFPK